MMNRYVDADVMILDMLNTKIETKCAGVSIEGIIKYIEENAIYIDVDDEEITTLNS